MTVVVSGDNCLSVTIFFSFSLLVVDLFCEKAIHEQKPIRTRTVTAAAGSLVISALFPGIVR